MPQAMSRPHRFTWPTEIVLPLVGHFHLINILAAQLNDSDLESDHYHILNVSLSFMAMRMVHPQAPYVVSIHPQANFRAPPLGRRDAMAIADAGPGRRMVTRSQSATAQAVAGVEAAPEAASQPPTHGSRDEDDDGVVGEFSNAPAEESFITESDVTEASEVPREQTSYPDFASILNVLKKKQLRAASKDVDILRDNERHILFLHEAKQWPMQFYVEPDMTREAKGRLVEHVVQGALVQAAEQAYRAFNEYPGYNVLHVMIHVGTWYCVATFNRKVVQRWMREKEAGRNRDPPCSVSEVAEMFKYTTYKGKISLITEYSSQFKSVMTRVKNLRSKHIIWELEDSDPESEEDSDEAEEEEDEGTED